MNQERQYGVCWHRMTAAIDQGPVLKRENFAIDPDETAVSLITKCLAAGVRSFSLLVADLAGDAVVEEIQGSAGHSYFGKHRGPTAAAVLDRNRSAAELDALVRGLQFRAYANPLGSPKVFFKDVAYIVTAASLVPTGGSSPEGNRGSGHAHIECHTKCTPEGNVRHFVSICEFPMSRVGQLFESA